LKPLRVGVVAGEASGDALAAGLMASLKTHYPAVEFIGIAGPKMREVGCKVLYDTDALAVMSIVEVIGHLPRILWMRCQVYRALRHSIDVFIGVDAPEFNLPLARKLRRCGIKTVQYNGPKIWAWRRGRVHKLVQAMDVVLTLLPFENQHYSNHPIKAVYVGHPLADQIPLEPDQVQARQTLKLALEQPILAVLPGSRAQEVQALGPIFLETVDRLQAQIPGLLCLVPVLNEQREQQFQQLLSHYGKALPIQLVRGQSQQIMAAADVVLLASGTATLEAMLLKKPMVVAYRLAWLSYWIIKSLTRCRFIALPNLLADQALVEEFIQARAVPPLLAAAIVEKFNNQALRQQLLARFSVLHQQLRCGAHTRAAEAVLELVHG
jgi:lipid-A-disaccharide synthase